MCCMIQWASDPSHLRIYVWNIAMHLHLHCKITIGKIAFFILYSSMVHAIHGVEYISCWCCSVMEIFFFIFFFVHFRLFVWLFCVMLGCYCSLTIWENMCNHLQPLTPKWHTHIYRMCFACEVWVVRLRKQFGVAIVEMFLR